jgi:hypothetical protein
MYPLLLLETMGSSIRWKARLNGRPTKLQNTVELHRFDIQNDAIGGLAAR